MPQDPEDRSSQQGDGMGSHLFVELVLLQVETGVRQMPVDEAYLLGFVDALHTTRWSSRNSEPALVALDLTSSVCAQVQMHLQAKPRP